VAGAARPVAFVWSIKTSRLWRLSTAQSGSGRQRETHAAAVTEYVLKTLVDGVSIPTVMGLLAAQLMQNESFRFLYHHHNQRISSRSRLTLACKRKIWKQATPPVQYKGGLLPQ
jgi:hypothetical protein